MDASDEALVAEARRTGARSQAAYTELVRRHQSWIIRYLWHLLGRRSDAEDVAQEAFAQAYVTLSTLRDPTRFRGWLRQIATRLAFNHQRDAKTRRGYEERAPFARTVVSSEASLEALQALQAVLDRLAYPYREVLLLHYVEELAIKDIADVLDIGVSAAKMRLSRARREFRAVHEDLV